MWTTCSAGLSWCVLILLFDNTGEVFQSIRARIAVLIGSITAWRQFSRSIALDPPSNLSRWDLQLSLLSVLANALFCTYKFVQHEFSLRSMLPHGVFCSNHFWSRMMGSRPLHTHLVRRFWDVITTLLLVFEWIMLGDLGLYNRTGTGCVNALSHVFAFRCVKLVFAV